MKRVYIETRYTGIPKIGNVSDLPKKIAIVGTVQYVSFFPKIIDDLKTKGIDAKILSTKQIHKGQILGCDVNFNESLKNINAILYIGDGFFHPIKISFTYEIPVYRLEPRTGKIDILDEKRVEEYKKKKKGAYLKFMSSDIIGVIFTTKSGQSRSTNIIPKLIKKFPNKEFYTFISDEIGNLENFPFIKAWINTACPRIEEDFRCVNIDDLID